MWIIFRKMESKTHQVRVTNRKLSRSAIVPATTFVELKRKIVTELCMSGWLSVKVYKAESFEVICSEKSNKKSSIRLMLIHLKRIFSSI